jgi:predicted nucleic acid-binding protein
VIAVDTSLLAFAVNRYAPGHGRATAVLERLMNGDTPWALPWTVVEEFLGFVTHPHRVSRVLAARDAWAFVTELGAGPAVRWLAPGERHAAALAELLEQAPAGGPPPPGFALAVLMREHGVRVLLTADRGMRRYRFLEIVDPLHGEPWTPATPPTRRYRRRV